MSLDRITKKPILPKVDLEVLLDEYIEPEVSIEALDISSPLSETNGLLVEFNTEKTEYASLLSSIVEDIPNTQVILTDTQKELLGVDNFSLQILQNWMQSGESIWPSALLITEDRAYSAGNSAPFMLWGVVQETFNDLLYDIDAISSTVQNGGIKLKARTNIYNRKLEKYRDLRARIQESLRKGLERLPECFLENTLRTLTRGSRTVVSPYGTTSFVPSTISRDYVPKSDLLRSLSSLRLILRYRSINSKIDWRTTRNNLLNRLKSRAAHVGVARLNNALGRLDQNVTTNIVDFLGNFYEISQENFCGEFNEAIGIISETAESLRRTYASAIIQEEKKFLEQFQDRGRLVALVDERIFLNKQEDLIDVILESIENIVSTGELTQTIKDYVQQQTKVKIK